MELSVHKQAGESMPGREAKALRESLGLSKSALGRLVGMHRHTVRKWEHGEAPPVVGMALRYLRERARRRWQEDRRKRRKVAREKALKKSLEIAPEVTEKYW